MAKYNSVKGKLPKGGGKGLSGDALVGKVSQSTIDDIKRMGMTKALALAGKNGKTSGGMAREFQEGVRRMYGAKRLEAAKAKYAPSTAGKGRSSTGMGGVTKPAPSTKPGTKLNRPSTADKLKVVGGTVAAIGLIAKGGPAGRKAATKLAPGLMKTVGKSTIGKALLGSGKPLTSKAFAAAKAAPKANAAKVTVGPKGSFGKTTLQQAKSGLGTASEYASKAGQASARASVKASGPDAARAAATKTIKPRSTNTPAKPMPKTAKGKANYGKYGSTDEYLIEKNLAKATTKKKVALAGGAASSSARTGKK